MGHSLNRVTRAIVAVLLAAMFLVIVPEALVADDSSSESVWFPAADPPDDQLLSTVKLADGRIAVSLRIPLIYDPYTGEWRRGTPHEDANLGDGHGWTPSNAVVVGDGRIFVAGGTSSAGISPGSTGSTDRAAFYDPSVDEWTDAASMNEERVSPTTTLLPDGSVLVVSGNYGQGVQISTGSYLRKSTERYYPNEDSWEVVGELSEPRFGHSTHLVEDGTVVVLGGYSGPGEAATTVEKFDTNADTWVTVTENVPEGLEDHESFLLPGGDILVMSASVSSNSNDNDTEAGKVWIFDPDTGEFESRTPMPGARTSYAAELLSDGSVLVSGGIATNGDANESVSTTERYDPELDEWIKVASMLESREAHEMVALDEAQGAVAYVIGGAGSRGNDAAPEVFYPSAPGIVDRQPPPAEADTNHEYFPETGHYLSWGFKDFWEESGGLPVFGYPLTTEFDEFNPDLDEDRTSQYFERQRFEYHPEHAGTHYEVQLGRLGYAEAAERGLTGSTEFQPVDRDELGDDCHYFSEIGHAACGEFLEYWDRHGLEFGDEGVSFRESVALFGYPISVEFEDPDTGLMTQYFERARFELHPDNPAEYRILLGRLGADIVNQRDW